MSTSMVEGSPLKLMLRFAMPLLAGNLLQQTYNIIDAAIVGQTLGAQALAGRGGAGGSGSQQQCTVPCTWFLYGKLCGIWRSHCEIFWRRGSEKDAGLRI